VVPAVWCVSFSQLVTFTIYEKDWYEEDGRFCSHCGEAMMSAFPSINREKWTRAWSVPFASMEK
jgi:hypothetical protein